MATRNLARTVVEGGRKGRFIERVFTRSQRKLTRQQLHGIDCARDAEESFAVMGKVYPDRRDHWWGTDFADRLTAVERYLQANAGRPWNKVFSELCSKYDRRSLKGWHMIDGHINNHMVAKPGKRFLFGGSNYPPRSGAWVDAHGILRYTQRTKWWLTKKK
jgi:hypothetical protein